VIVRISGEDQYRLDSAHDSRLSELDNAVLAAVESEDETRFHAAYGELLQFVRANGVPVGDDELEGSDLILPPADISLVEARSEFTGEGLIPD
jgi:hypothetical protein